MKKINTRNPDLIFLSTKKNILEQIKKDKNTLYGGQAIKKHIGPFARPTQDFDILSKNPRKSAKKLEKSLDKSAGYNHYYSKKAMHPGTFKVKHVGKDRKQNTRDDLEVADFTKPKRKHNTITIKGIKYVKIEEILKDKKKSLSDKKYKFRHKKDKEDYDRIRYAQKTFKRYQKRYSKIRR